MSQSCLQQLQMVTSVKIPAGVLNRTGLSRSSLGEIRQAELLNVSLTEIAVSSSVLRFVNPSADFSTQSCFRHPPPPFFLSRNEIKLPLRDEKANTAPYWP